MKTNENKQDFIKLYNKGFKRINTGLCNSKIYRLEISIFNYI